MGQPARTVPADEWVPGQARDDSVVRVQRGSATPVTEKLDKKDWHVLLGVPNFANYESAAAVVAVPRGGGAIRYHCISEDRLTREKHSYTFPLRSIDYCLAAFGLDGLADVERIFTDYARLPRWHNSGPAYRKLEHDYLKAKLDFPRERIEILDHHDAHAASCYYPSGFEEAAVLIVDGMGSALETQSLYHGRGETLELIERGRGWGVGKLYSIVTGQVLPYGPEKGFGKVMGLAPYGEAHPGPVLDFGARNEGLTTDYSGFYSRQPVSRLLAENLPRCTDRKQVMEPAFARAAYDVQCECEEQLVRMARHAHERTGSTRLCLAGGVILNGRANHLILERTPIEEIWMPPCVSDCGIPFGLALWGAYNGPPERAERLSVAMPHAYTGREIGDAEIEAELGRAGVAWRETDCEQVAGLIAEGKVVAWFDGASEYGPRALGHRSILADPTREDMKEVLNSGVKFREAYRPYAPSVLAEHARDWFDLLAPSPFMLHVCTVKADKRVRVPAITHVDGTARIQEVSREHSPRYWALIEAFRRRSGVPLLLNTSFNVNREPIVETVADALICALRTKIDVLVFNGRILVACDDYRDPGITQGLTEQRSDDDDAKMERLHARYLTGFDPAERDAFLERENATAAWYLAGAPRYEAEKLVARAWQEGLRLLVAGTAGHAQVLYEYLPDVEALTVVGAVQVGAGPGEPGVWPPGWPSVALDGIDWSQADLVLISTHEYQDEAVAALEAAGCPLPIATLYDSAMDSLYFTLPEGAVRLHEIGEAPRSAAAVRAIDEVAGAGDDRDGGGLAERYGFVVNYHFVRPAEGAAFEGQVGITPEALGDQLRALADNFAFVTASELADPAAGLDESSALVTFDDGLKDVIDYAAPVLRRFGIRATVFLPTLPYAEGRVIQTHKRQLIMGRLGAERFRKAFYERLDGQVFEREDPARIGVVNAYRYDSEEVRRFKLDLNYCIPYAVLDPLLDRLFAELFGEERAVVERLYMSRDDLLRLQDVGWEIGGHGHRHLVMSRLGADDQRADAETCLDCIGRLFERPPTSFAYPFGGPGSYGAETVAAVRAAGYRAGYTVGRDIVRPGDLADAMTIPRFDNQDLFDRHNRLDHAKLEVLSTGD